MTVTACPEGKDDPLSYDQLDGEWRQWYTVAHRFERKVPTQDRGDIRHSIILELALARRRDGDKPFSEGMMCRVASFVVADYWRKEKRKPTIFSLDHRIEDGDGNGTDLIETVADDRAIDLDAWLDARTWLLGCPRRLVVIASKRLEGITIDRKDQKYLESYRRHTQMNMLEHVAFRPLRTVYIVEPPSRLAGCS